MHHLVFDGCYYHPIGDIEDSLKFPKQIRLDFNLKIFLGKLDGCISSIRFLIFFVSIIHLILFGICYFLRFIEKI